MQTRIPLSEPWPTLSTVALDIRQGAAKKDCTREDVARAARRRNVTMHNGRVSRCGLAALFFEVQR